MPTAAKLVAAVAFALLGFFAAELIKPLLPEGTQFGYFSLIAAGIGVLCGWFVMGGLVGAGYYSASGFGVRTSATLVFWSVVLLSIIEMVKLSIKLRYEGPMDAIQGAFEIALGYLRLMVDPGVIGVLLIGGALAGMFAEWSSKRWR